MSEQPAASINCGYTASGLPIGLQIVGQRHDDLGVLQVARAWEQMRPAQRPGRRHRPMPRLNAATAPMHDPRGNPSRDVPSDGVWRRGDPSARSGE